MFAARRKIAVFTFSVLMLCSAPKLKTSAGEGPGTTGAGYLTYPVSVKSMAMGESGVAVSGDPFNWITNPATLKDMNGIGAGVSHSEWLLDTNYDNAIYYNRLSHYIILSVGLVYTYRPEIDGYDEFGNPTEELLDSYNYQGLIGLGVTLSESFAVGANFKYFSEVLANRSAGGLAFDLGALYKFPAPDFSIGVSISNLGNDIRFESLEEPLPLTTRFGASYSKGLIDQRASLLISAEMVMPKFEEAYFAGGSEIRLYKILALRAGFCERKQRPGNGITVGGGLFFNERMSFDYAYTAMGDLGSFHRISVHVKIR